MIRLDRVLSRWSNNRLLVGIRNGFVLLTPFFIMGSLVVLINNLPIPAYQDMMSRIFGSSWKEVLAWIWEYTFGIIGIMTSVSVAYSLAKEFREDSTTSFVVALFSLVNVMIAFRPYDEALAITDFGPGSIFMSLIVGIFTYFLFKLVRDSYPYFRGERRIFLEESISSSMGALVPGLITVVIGFLIKLSQYYVFEIYETNNVLELIRFIFEKTGDRMIGAVLHSFLNEALWFFGIHGANFLYDASIGIIESNSVFTKGLMDTYVYLGGSGATISLIIALLLTTKRSRTRIIGYYSIVPALFNINEILLFGLPIILNPYLLIPFIVVPVIHSIVSVTVIGLGIVPPIVNSVEWTTPVLISGYLSTESIAGSLLQLFNILVGVLIYLPFVRWYSGNDIDQDKVLIKEVSEKLHSDEYTNLSHALESSKTLHYLFRKLSVELKFGMNHLEAYMVYQPLMKKDQTCYGVEALLRWKHPVYGMISPMLTVAAAENSDLIEELTFFTIEQTVKDMKSLHKEGFPIKISVNISPTVLQKSDFAKNLEKLREQVGFKSESLLLEITETIGITKEDVFLTNINALLEYGYTMALDDFGMGFTSLMMIRKSRVGVVKIDGSLTKAVQTDHKARMIVKGLIDLSKELNLKVVSEFIETTDQFELLKEMGCEYYQGYLFGKPMEYEILLDRLRTHYQASATGSQSRMVVPPAEGESTSRP